jgi:hypothetical protein
MIGHTEERESEGARDGGLGVNLPIEERGGLRGLWAYAIGVTGSLGGVGVMWM